MTTIIKLEAEVERLKLTAAKISEDSKERDEYKRLLTKLVRCVETFGSSGDEYNSALADANEALSETGGGNSKGVR